MIAFLSYMQILLIWYIGTRPRIQEKVMADYIHPEYLIGAYLIDLERMKNKANLNMK